MKRLVLPVNLLKKNNQSDVKYDALRFLAYAHKAKGDFKSAEAAIEQIPEMTFTKLTEKAYLLSGEAKFEAAEKQKLISSENLIQMMWKSAEYYEENGEIDKAIEETEKALDIISIISNAQFDIYIKYFNNQIERMKSKI